MDADICVYPSDDVVEHHAPAVDPALVKVAHWKRLPDIEYPKEDESQQHSRRPPPRADTAVEHELRET